jgi:hypothetical protein
MPRKMRPKIHSCVSGSLALPFHHRFLPEGTGLHPISLNRLKTQGIYSLKRYILIYKVCILVIGMRAREGTSRQSQQPLPAHLRLSAAQTSSEVMRANRFIAAEILPSDFLSLSERYLPLPTEADGSKQSVSNPSALNPFEINSTDGMTDRAPFFVKKSKAGRLSCVASTFVRGTEKQCRLPIPSAVLKSQSPRQ